MAKKGTRAGIALSIAGLVGGTYRLVSAYGGGALPDVLVPPASLDSGSRYDLTEVSSPAGGTTSESNWQEPTTDDVTEEEPDIVTVATDEPEVASSSWEEDMDEKISVELPCSGYLWEDYWGLTRKHIDVSFKWELTLNGKKDRENLMARKPIVKEATVSVTRKDNNKVLWDHTGGHGNVKAIEARWSDSGTVVVTLKSWVKGVIEVLGRDKEGTWQRSYLYCENTGLGRGWEKVFYKAGDLSSGNFGRINIGKTPMTLRVTLDQCVDKKNGKEQECDLRVITGRYLRWKSRSNKFETKVTLSTNKK